MAVLRVVANLATADPAALARFYTDLFGLDPRMDMGWIVTLGSEAGVEPQLTLASEGGSGTPVPHLSIEVDDFEAVLSRARGRNIEIAYGPVDEPWGVRRFFLRDPDGRLINVLQHR